MSDTVFDKPGAKVKLSTISEKPPKKLTEEDARQEFDKLGQELFDLQDLLWGSRMNSVLVILQGRDSAGKDGAIKHVAGCLNPRGVHVTSFGVPTTEELEHDFLWRVHRQAPRKGEFAIFNRSHYEDVLVVRVHDSVPKSLWKERYEHIRDFEQLLAEHGTIVLKFFLHISKGEQKKRLLEREEDPRTAWKLNSGDWEERELWEEYTDAYEERSPAPPRSTRRGTSSPRTPSGTATSWWPAPSRTHSGPIARPGRSSWIRSARTRRRSWRPGARASARPPADADYSGGRDLRTLSRASMRATQAFTLGKASRSTPIGAAQHQAERSEKSASDSLPQRNSLPASAFSSTPTSLRTFSMPAAYFASSFEPAEQLRVDGLHHHLAGGGAEGGGLPLQPLLHQGHALGVRGQQPALGLLRGQVTEDGVGLPETEAVVLERGHLAVGVHREEVGRLVLALASCRRR